MMKSKLTNAQFYNEKGAWYATLTYILEDDHCVKEAIFPKVKLGINEDAVPTISYPTTTCTRGDYFTSPLKERFINFGGNSFELLWGVGHDGANHVYYTEKIIEKKTRKMTVAEIEKKLGYKIEIVSEDEE